MHRVRQPLVQVISAFPKLPKRTIVWDKMPRNLQSGKQKALAGGLWDGSFHGLTMIWWLWKFKSHQPKCRELQATTWVWRVAIDKPRVLVKRTLLVNYNRISARLLMSLMMTTFYYALSSALNQKNERLLFLHSSSRWFSDMSALRISWGACGTRHPEAPPLNSDAGALERSPGICILHKHRDPDGPRTTLWEALMNTSLNTSKTSFTVWGFTGSFKLNKTFEQSEHKYIR